MKRKKLIGILLTSLLFSGCADSTIKITKADAIEVAQDDANADVDTCQNVSVQKGTDFYKVQFDTDKGRYVYKINLNGLIKKRDYHKFEDGSEVSSQESSEQSTSTSSQTKEETKTENDANKEKAIQAALVNVGQSEEDVSELTCTLNEDQSQYIVTFKVGDTNNTVYVDAQSFSVVSTVTGGE